MAAEPPARTVGELLTRADDGAAIVVPGGPVLSHAELHDAIEGLARELVDAGVRPGDTVALSGPNSPQAIVGFLAALRAGAAAAPLNPAYTAQEAEGYLRDLAPRLLLLEGDADVARAAAGLDIPVAQTSGGTFSLGRSGAASLPEPPGPDAVALVLHTSGTTSRPKVVPLRHRHLAASMVTIADGYGLGPEDVSHCVMPLFHVHGLLASALAPLAAGGAVLAPARFSASAFWADTVAHRATWFSAVPTIHQVLALRADTEPIPRHALRFARSCSSALAPVLQDRVETLLGVPLLQAYGMTEAAHQMASNPLPPGERRAGSVGRATGVEIAILDESWAAVGKDTPGEVAIRGPSVVEGYRDNETANRESFRDGWFRTGDVGRLAPDGYLTLEGRSKELINRGGEKISPFEVEDALLAHHAVAEAVAYAIPDDKYGEVVGAVVVASGPVGAAELSAHCADRLAAFKVPGRIRLLAEIPKGPTGKVQRRMLAEQLER